jgi:HlyD family secretion protein
MKATPNIFRAAAVERLSSPEQLDQLIDVTRPLDWVGAVAIGLALIGLLTWGFIGRVPTRAAGEGILISDSGRVVDGVSAVTGRLTSVEVSVGDRVASGQAIARISQTGTEQRYRGAVELFQERERERDELFAAIKRELEIKAANVSAQKSRLEAIIAASRKRLADVADANPEGGSLSAPAKEAEDRSPEVFAIKQRIADSQNEIERIEGQQREADSQKDLDRLASQLKVDEARRQSEQLAAMLDRDSQLTSPIDGRVIEIKVSAGGVLAPGTPVVSIEPEEVGLEAIIYVPADRGKNILPGMEARIEPSTVKREEFGAMIGKVADVSRFPVSPEGMAAALHNDALVRRFSLEGASYAVGVRFERDPSNVSGYVWSSGAGPPVHLTTGTLARAEITTREQPPIDLIVPIMRRFGIGG